MSLPVEGLSAALAARRGRVGYSALIDAAARRTDGQRAVLHAARLEDGEEEEGEGKPGMSVAKLPEYHANPLPFGRIAASW